MQKNKAEKLNKKSFAQMLKEPKVMQAAIMLAISSLVLAIAVFSLNSLGFFHMLAGFTIPRGAVKEGVIYEKIRLPKYPRVKSATVLIRISFSITSIAAAV